MPEDEGEGDESPSGIKQPVLCAKAIRPRFMMFSSQVRRSCRVPDTATPGRHIDNQEALTVAFSRAETLKILGEWDVKGWGCHVVIVYHSRVFFCF